ncbi:MAG: hypothetical protein MPN21_06860 [Thermoanaerobaculia bacterium]|nr:hypothetical protein [Thermoanaerobaculia bacterium]
MKRTIGRTTSKTIRTVTMLVAIALTFQTTASCQQDIPESAKKIMAIFQEAESWPAYGPGEIGNRPGKFKPVRSVFARETNLSSGQPTSVRAVWEVDQIAWEGRPVTMISWFSGGQVAPRSSVGYVSPETGALLYREISSTTKITMTLVEPKRFIDQAIDREGKVESETVDHQEPAFDRWALGQMMAGMELKEGLKFKMKGLYPGVKEALEYLVYVGTRTTIQDTQGNDLEVWPVLHPLGGSNIGTYYVDSREPYMFGFEMRDIVTDQVGMRITLSHYQLLD